MNDAEKLEYEELKSRCEEASGLAGIPYWEALFSDEEHDWSVSAGRKRLITNYTDPLLEAAYEIDMFEYLRTLDTGEVCDDVEFFCLPCRDEGVPFGILSDHEQRALLSTLPVAVSFRQ